MSPITEQTINAPVAIDVRAGPTGPRTAEGKSRCRLNAVRHGLTSQSLHFTSPEEAEAYRAHAASIHAHYKPHGPIEEALVRQIADAIFRLDRATAIEHGIFALAFESSGPADDDPGLTPARAWFADGKNLALLTLYVKRIENKLDANKAELSLIQHNRKQEADEAMNRAVVLKRAAAVEGKLYDPAAYFHPQPETPESVFSPALVDREIANRAAIQNAQRIVHQTHCTRHIEREAA